VDIDPKKIDIKIPKELTKGTIKKVDLVVKISE
jgi:hypothetical protein